MRLSSIFRRCHQDNTNTLLSKLTVIMHAVQVKTEWWPEAHAGGETAWTIVKVWMCNHGEKCETDKRVKGTFPRGRDESGAEKWWELIWERGQKGNPSNNQTGTNRTGYLNCLAQKWCNSFFLEKNSFKIIFMVHFHSAPQMPVIAQYSAGMVFSETLPSLCHTPNVCFISVISVWTSR